MLLVFPILLATASLLAAQPPKASPAPAVTVPAFPNSTCPIMGKKVSLPLFADTVHGRIYVCCKPCIRKIHADVAAAYATAYPAVEDLANPVCPVTGEPIGAGSATVVLQGTRVRLCCADCADVARRDTQVTLARARAPQLTDAGNTTCPVDGKPVQPNAFAVVGDTVVRLSSPAHVAELKKAPQAFLDKARAATGKKTQRHQPGGEKP